MIGVCIDLIFVCSILNPTETIDLYHYNFSKYPRFEFDTNARYANFFLYIHDIYPELAAERKIVHF